MSRRHRSGPIHDQLIKKPCGVCHAKVGQSCHRERPCLRRLKKIKKEG